MLDFNSVRTIIEPFRIKSVEPLRAPRPSNERTSWPEPATTCSRFVRATPHRLLTDSGTSACPPNNGGHDARRRILRGERELLPLRTSVRELTGFRHVIPTHQGRAAERILFSIMCRPGQSVPNNTHLTPRAPYRIQRSARFGLRLRAPRYASAPSIQGNLDVEALEKLMETEGPAKIPL